MLYLATFKQQTRIELEVLTKMQEVLFNSFPMNGHTLGFCTWSQKLENFVSPKVSLSGWMSQGSAVY